MASVIPILLTFPEVKKNIVYSFNIGCDARGYSTSFL